MGHMNLVIFIFNNKHKGGTTLTVAPDQESKTSAVQRQRRFPVFWIRVLIDKEPLVCSVRTQFTVVPTRRKSVFMNSYQAGCIPTGRRAFQWTDWVNKRGEFLPSYHETPISDITPIPL